MLAASLSTEPHEDEALRRALEKPTHSARLHELRNEVDRLQVMLLSWMPPSHCLPCSLHPHPIPFQACLLDLAERGLNQQLTISADANQRDRHLANCMVRIYATQICLCFAR